MKIGKSLVWDLAGYDFSNFAIDQAELSEQFHISNVNVWLSLWPKGSSESEEGKAALFLFVDQPVVLRWSMQWGNNRPQIEQHDFSNTSEGWGDSDFMPSSETKGSITIRILATSVPGSTLWIMEVRASVLRLIFSYLL